MLPCGLFPRWRRTPCRTRLLAVATDRWGLTAGEELDYGSLIACLVDTHTALSLELVYSHLTQHDAHCAPSAVAARGHKTQETKLESLELQRIADET